jgi:mRNA interferase RelE/StbE
MVRTLHPELKAKIRAALDTLRREPASGKSIRGDLSGLRSFRVGRFRIIYRDPSTSVIEIVAIGPRKSIYQETFRLIARRPGKTEPCDRNI